MDNLSLDAVEKLIKKAAETGDPEEAMAFSQAAVNVANAMLAAKAAKL